MLYKIGSGLSGLCGCYDKSYPAQDVKAFFGDLIVEDDLSFSSASNFDADDICEIASMFDTTVVDTENHPVDTDFRDVSHTPDGISEKAK